MEYLVSDDLNEEEWTRLWTTMDTHTKGEEIKAFSFPLKYFRFDSKDKIIQNDLIEFSWNKKLLKIPINEKEENMTIK